MIDGDRPGYKKTKIGWFPADWEVRRIDEVAPLQRGFDLPSKLLNNGKYPVVYSNGVLNYHSDFKVKGPGVVTGRSGTIGKVTFVESDYWPHNTSLWVTDFKGNFPKYIFYFFQHLRLERFNAGTGVPTLNRNDVHSFKIPLPPLAEQKKIAEILSTWDRAIELTDKLIAAKEQRKKALMQRLLTGKVRFREFAGEAWCTRKIKDVGNVVSGGTPSTANDKYWDGTINWCTPTDITALKGSKYLGPTIKKISQLGYKMSSANLLPENSVIVCTRATIGDCAINIVPMTTNQGFKSIIPKNVHPEFLYYEMLTKKPQLLRLANGSTFSEVSKADFENLSLSIPQNFAEQQKIAAVLQAADREIELLRQKREALVQQKKGLMQVLLTGKVRVNIAETRRDPEGVG